MKHREGKKHTEESVEENRGKKQCIVFCLFCLFVCLFLRVPDAFFPAGEMSHQLITGGGNRVAVTE